MRCSQTGLVGSSLKQWRPAFEYEINFNWLGHTPSIRQTRLPRDFQADDFSCSALPVVHCSIAAGMRPSAWICYRASVIDAFLGSAHSPAADRGAPS